jgi:hypothetical protein
MAYFIENKNSLIWAFNESIDSDTQFDGNTNEKSLTQTKQIIYYLISAKCFDPNITESILREYMCILDYVQTIIPSKSSDTIPNEYLLCGWQGHSILLFWEKQPNELYNFGMINCGQGANLQGSNNVLCNGLVIFKDITKARVDDFLQTYKKYESNTNYDDNFKKNQIYNIFYIILFDKLLDKKDCVNFNNLDESKVDFYKLDLQIIGSCSFTNLINLIYYIYIKGSPSKDHYADYLEWYNTAKKTIKIKIFNDIILSKDTTLVNMYKYILDTTDISDTSSLSDKKDEYELLVKNAPIKNKEIISQISFDTDQSLNTIERKTIDNCFNHIPNKEQVLDALWKIYLDHNLDPFIKLLNDTPENFMNLIDHLVVFYRNCESFHNGNNLIIPLLILYKLKTSDKLIKNIFTEQLLKPFYDEYIERGKYKQMDKINIHIATDYSLINLFIYLLLINECIPDRERYYLNSDVRKKKANILCYNYALFKNIPIINYYYSKIVNDLVEDLNNNINIFPDITDKDAIYSKPSYYSLGIHYSKKFIGKYIANIGDSVYYNTNDRYTNNNFLLWYMLVNNMTDTLDFKFYSQDVLLYETYGYYNKEIYDEQKANNFIINTKVNSEIADYPGGFKLTDQNILLFKETIRKKLAEKPSTTFITLKEYIIYFYLCELSGDELKTTDDIFKTYNPHINKYFDELWSTKLFSPLIYTYILKYNQTYYVPTKLIIELDKNSLIANAEKNVFLLSRYEYTIGENELLQSVINFYKIKYNDKYTLFIHSNDKNKPESINIIKSQLKSFGSIYLALNFYYSKNGKQITGTNKNDKKIKIEYNEDNLSNIYYIDNGTRYKIIKFTQLPDSYHQFYNLMTNNDINLFVYLNEENGEYFLRTLNYDFVFKMYNGLVYYTINDIEYQVHFCDDIDIYHNYGILKLSHETGDKLLCIYNYNHIFVQPTRLTRNPLDFNFINKNFFYEIELIIKMYTNYYVIINKFKDKYVFSNINEVLALLINCLNYNSPYLILKNIEQIKNILNKNNKNENIQILKTLFNRFDNLYSIPIILLFYNNKILNEYYYLHANKLYDKYQILLKLNYNENTLSDKFIYTTLFVEFGICSTIKFHENLFYFQNTFYDYGNEIYYEVYDDQYYFYINQLPSSSVEQIFKGPRSEYVKYITSPTRILISDTGVFKVSKYSLIIKYLKQKTTDYTSDVPYTHQYQSLFKSLLKVFIPQLDENVFEKNIIKATELFNYLIKSDKTELYPIQELIMGSGKTTSITPYICILLLQHFLKRPVVNHDYDNEIFIVMPEFLINSSFEILMKHLFPLFANIEILVYEAKSEKPNYPNSFRVYLISDTNYKIMFLEKTIDTEKKYMIYDEVDMMANPLTCELNKPFNEVQLNSIDELYKISEILYNDIFTNEKFWIGLSKDYQSNHIHNYIYNLSTDTIEFINKYYDEQINKHFNQSEKAALYNLIKYIKSNVLLFILTKQFNYDYGMPEDYSVGLSDNYKFKAIPYSAVDNPVMGSEFSDFILTYVLTFFCYKIVNSKYRSRDKDYIIDYYDSLCNNDDTYVDKLFNFLKEYPNSYKHYKNYQEHFKSTYKDEFDLKPSEFEVIIKQILKLNTNYYLKCRNISFNDLLLYKNVKNFICFTGTAYIKPPISYGFTKNINFNPGNYITYSPIDTYANVSDAIVSIIRDANRVRNIYNNNRSDMLIEDIFSCLNKYDVLIDIGGIFIKFNITSFIKEYKKLPNRKEYLVYFDNGIKVYHLATDQFANDDVIKKKDSKTFYYFSNKNITGVDAKNIMNIYAHGLITITNKTTMRDFSQGIFRMRDISKTQTCDIIFNNKFNDIIMKGGYDNFIKIEKPKIRETIIKHLKAQQKIIDKQKKKVLIKQNIFALNKQTTDADTNEQILYLDPMSDLYNDSNCIFNKFVEKYKPIINKFDIDSLNIIEKNTKEILDKNSFLECLVTKYFTYQTDVIESKQNMVKDDIEEQDKDKKEKSKSNEQVTNQIISIPHDSSNSNKGTIYYNLKYKDYDKDQILVTYDFTRHDIQFSIKSFPILLIYDNDNNNLVIIDISTLTKFLIYNENINDRYTFISVYNKSSYGKIIDDELLKHLIRIVLGVLHHIKIEDKEKKNTLSKLIKNLKTIKYNDSFNLKTTLTLKFIHGYSKYDLDTDDDKSCGNEIVEDLDTTDYYAKYVKYKTKYLNLKNFN